MPPKPMPMGKAARGAQRSEKLIERDDISQPAPGAVTLPAINIATYPHLFTLIIRCCSTATLLTLMRCSRKSLKTVAPYLYRSPRITTARLGELVEIGWAANEQSTRAGNRAASTSASARQCLQQIHTLHLLNFDPDAPFPNVPRGLFPNCNDVVLHLSPDFPVGHFPLPSWFRAFEASHLYIRLTEAHAKSQPDHSIDCFIDYLPRSYKSVTLLVPLAPYLAGAPFLGFYPTAQANVCEVSVVLLPWRSTEVEAKDVKSMPYRWSTHHRPYNYHTANHSSRFIGSFRQDFIPDQRRFIDGIHLAPREQTLVLFGEWLHKLRKHTVFSMIETAWLAMVELGLSRRITEHTLAAVEEYMAARIQDAEEDPESFERQQLSSLIASARRVGMDATEAEYDEPPVPFEKVLQAHRRALEGEGPGWGQNSAKSLFWGHLIP